MKAGKLLMVDADSVSAPLVAQAAAVTGHDVLEAQTCQEALHHLACELGEVDVVVIDLDRGVHGPVVLQAMEVAPTAPPVIVLTSSDKNFATPGSTMQKAVACLGKPSAVLELAAVIAQVSGEAFRAGTCTSDAWGHPHRCQNSLLPCPACRREARQPSEAPALAIP